MHIKGIPEGVNLLLTKSDESVIDKGLYVIARSEATKQSRVFYCHSRENGNPVFLCTKEPFPGAFKNWSGTLFINHIK